MSFRYSVAGPSTTYVRARTRHNMIVPLLAHAAVIRTDHDGEIRRVRVLLSLSTLETDASSKSHTSWHQADHVSRWGNSTPRLPMLFGARH